MELKISNPWSKKAPKTDTEFVHLATWPSAQSNNNANCDNTNITVIDTAKLSVLRKKASVPDRIPEQQDATVILLGVTPSLYARYAMTMATRFVNSASMTKVSSWSRPAQNLEKGMVSFICFNSIPGKADWKPVKDYGMAMSVQIPLFRNDVKGWGRRPSTRRQRSAYPALNILSPHSSPAVASKIE